MTDDQVADHSHREDEEGGGCRREQAAPGLGELLVGMLGLWHPPLRAMPGKLYG
jgi:hypothetical protein